MQQIGASVHHELVERGETVEVSADGRMAELFLRHGHEAKRLAYLMTGNMALAEDLAQDAFLRACGRLAHLRDPDKFPAYLRKTVVNSVRMHYRRHASSDLPLGEGVAAAPGADPDAMMDMRAALLNLPQRQRAAIVLRYYADLPDDESADILRCRRATVRSLIARGMETLREEMSIHDG